MPRGPQLRIAAPPCDFCMDGVASWDALTPWDCRAALCEPCYARLGRDPVAIVPVASYHVPTVEEVREYLDAQTWKFAKTMKRWPHEYVVLCRSTDPWMHLRALAFIRRHGTPRRWQGRWYTYWTYGPHEYWTMDLHVTTLNRRDTAEDVPVAQ